MEVSNVNGVIHGDSVTNLGRENAANGVSYDPTGEWNRELSNRGMHRIRSYVGLYVGIVTDVANVMNPGSQLPQSVCQSEGVALNCPTINRWGSNYSCTDNHH